MLEKFMSGIQTRAAVKESFNRFEGKAVYFNSILTITSTTVNIAVAIQEKSENSALFGLAITINIISIIFDAICSFNKMQALRKPREKYNSTFNNPTHNNRSVDVYNNEYVAPVVGLIVGGLTLGLGFFGKSSIGSNAANTFQILSPVVSNVICDIAQHVADSEKTVLEEAMTVGALRPAIEDRVIKMC